jgi:hypothetical protein
MVIEMIWSTGNAPDADVHMCARSVSGAFFFALCKPRYGAMVRVMQ